jgi:hypothetical protein
MGIPFPQPRYMPCSDCGEAVERGSEDEHVCDRGRLLDYQVFQLHAEVEGIDKELDAFLETPRGRFELWWAARERRLRDGG